MTARAMPRAPLLTSESMARDGSASAPVERNLICAVRHSGLTGFPLFHGPFLALVIRLTDSEPGRFTRNCQSGLTAFSFLPHAWFGATFALPTDLSTDILNLTCSRTDHPGVFRSPSHDVHQITNTTLTQTDQGTHLSTSFHLVEHCTPSLGVNLGTHLSTSFHLVEHCTPTLGVNLGTHLSTSFHLVEHCTPSLGVNLGTHLSTSFHLVEHCTPSLGVNLGTHLSTSFHLVEYCTPSFGVNLGMDLCRPFWSGLQI